LNYITSRGNWYFSSWKADLKKSGGIASNIGIHFFDMLIWIFGDVISYELSFSDEKTMIGILVFKNSIVNWKLSVDKNELPSFISKELKTYRSIKINDEEMEFSNGFTDLHTLSYEQILEGKGFKISDSLKSIKLVSELRTLKIKND
jgi:UDP-N-acetyl-2-amino-2-deoxyglucuronate dehydrogenase